MIPNGSTVSVQSLHQEKDLIFFALWYENTKLRSIHHPFTSDAGCLAFPGTQEVRQGPREINPKEKLNCFFWGGKSSGKFQIIRSISARSISLLNSIRMWEVSMF